MCRTYQGKKGWNSLGKRIMYKPGMSNLRQEDHMLKVIFSYIGSSKKKKMHRWLWSFTENHVLEKDFFYSWGGGSESKALDLKFEHSSVFSDSGWVSENKVRGAGEKDDSVVLRAKVRTFCFLRPSSYLFLPPPPHNNIIYLIFYLRVCICVSKGANVHRGQQTSSKSGLSSSSIFLIIRL